MSRLDSLPNKNNPKLVCNVRARELNTDCLHAHKGKTVGEMFNDVMRAMVQGLKMHLLGG